MIKMVGLRRSEAQPVDSKMRKSQPWRRWCVCLGLVFCLPLVYIVSMSNDINYHTELFVAPLIGHEPETLTVTQVNTAFLVDTPGCRIPALDPFDPLVRKYVKKQNPLQCAAKYPVLIESNLTALFVVLSALSAFNVTDVSELDCCYRPFWRVEGNITKYKSDVDNKNKFAENCTSFSGEVAISEEFVEASCSVAGSVVYRDFHAFFPLKTAVEERCAEARRDPAAPETLSVLMVGLDSVSRLNLHRQMPLTVAQLAEMEAIEMLGYNKVGDNTFPNLVPALSGLTEKELKPSCWPKSKYSFDRCPWVWKNFSAAGHRTVFGEDAPWMGIFSYLKVGFVKRPTDYYMRPIAKLSEDKIGHTKPGNAKLCIGARITSEVLLSYVSKFAQSMSGLPTFSLFWGASLSHDYLNYASLADEMHRDLMLELETSGALNKTAFVFLSDHGLRFGDIRETYQGRLEERLPFLFFAFPRWFRERFTLAVSNMRRNMRRLTSPFDLHSTLLDFLDLSQIDNDAIRKRTLELQTGNSQPLPRGISLFLPIPENRTCQDAGIDPHWCTCQVTQSLNVSSPVVQDMSLFLLGHLNSLLKPYRACAQLELAEIKDARLEFPMEHLEKKTKDRGIKDYLLVVRTTPGDALFEATIRHRLGENTTNVAGTVSRINLYGTQSSCIAEYHMKLYCYCKPFLIS